MLDTVLWRKMGSIIMILAKRLDVPPARALRIFYQTDTCRQLHDPKYGLHLMSDFYIVDDIMMELQRKQ